MSVPVDTDLAGAVDDVLTRAAAEDQFSGVLRLEHGNELVHEGAYGVASRRWEVPVHAGMRFDLASVTKLFTSISVLQQVDAGTLDLDTSIAEWVDLAGTGISTEITLRHLLTHTSGIADDADEEAGESYEAIWADRPNYSVMRTEDFLPQCTAKPALFAPGTGCRYNNCGFVLAGLVLEKVTGTSYREYVQAEVFARAGMTASGFFDMRHAVPDVAEGWEPVRADEQTVGWRQNIYSYPPIGSPDGGAHCTAEDLVRFMHAVRGGELLSPERTELFLTPQVVHNEENGYTVTYGFGLVFEVLPDGRLRDFYKEGVNTGASAIVEHYPAQDVTLALVANSENGIWDPLKQIDELVYS